MNVENLGTPLNKIPFIASLKHSHEIVVDISSEGPTANGLAV